MKTHSSSKKRFKKTKTGKIKRSQAYKRHHAWAKTSKKNRALRGGTYLQGSDQTNIAKLLPYL